MSFTEQEYPDNKKIILEMKNITKKYSGVKALDNIDFTIKCGEVHGLVGKNGAGKSTLIKILSGVIADYEGDIFINGEKTNLSFPGYSHEKGISTVYQEFSLIPDLSVAENIYLGRYPQRKNFLSVKTIDKQKLNKDVEELFEKLGVSINPSCKVNNLSVSRKQLVEIAKAISVNPKVLLLDEPTSALAKEEVEKLFKVIQRLVQANVSIIYVSHILEDIERISDRVTVLRNGKKVATLKLNEITSEKIVNMMIGKDYISQRRTESFAMDKNVLEVKGISSANLLKNINFFLKEGEILGIAGLMGSGRTELVRCIFGLDKMDTGEVFLNNEKLYHISPDRMRDLQIGFSPEERKKQGIIPTMSVKNNLSIAALKILTKLGIINKRAERKSVTRSIERFQVKTSGMDNLITSLSGGNQQKVLIGRWFAINPKILILDEPTQGIDIEAKAQIYNILNDLAKEGVSVIIVSSELEELINVCDRILVMRFGEIVGNLQGKEIELERIVKLTMGVAN
jgi:ribose transport system ATP-binding protein